MSCICGGGPLKSMQSCHRLQASSHLILCKFRPTGFIGSLPTENIKMFTVGYGYCNYISQKYISTPHCWGALQKELQTQTVCTLHDLTDFWNHAVALPKNWRSYLTIFTYSFRFRSIFWLNLFLWKCAYMLLENLHSLLELLTFAIYFKSF